eukprot:364707-Chlamydomonas_euryale.AAC.3
MRHDGPPDEEICALEQEPISIATIGTFAKKPLFAHTRLVGVARNCSYLLRAESASCGGSRPWAAPCHPAKRPSVRL